MIQVFQGKKRGLGDGAEPAAYAKLDFKFREVIHHFKGAQLAVFLAIMLHSDENGLAFPSYVVLQRETGYGRDTIATALDGLCDLLIDGHHVLIRWRERGKDGKYKGGNKYLIFPSNDEVNLSEKPTLENPTLENPTLEKTNSGKSLPEVEPSSELEPQFNQEDAPEPLFVQPGDSPSANAAGAVAGVGQCICGEGMGVAAWSHSANCPVFIPRPRLGTPDTLHPAPVEPVEQPIDAPEPITSKHPAVAAFHKAWSRFPHKNSWADIAARIGGDSPDVARWEQTCRHWKLSGWDIRNLAGMFSRFDKSKELGVAPADVPYNGNGHKPGADSRVRGNPAMPERPSLWDEAEDDNSEINKQIDAQIRRERERRNNTPAR